LSRRVLSPTALALFLVFAVTAYAGATIIAFERMGARVENSLIALSTGAGGTLREVLDAVSEWTTTTSVSTRARNLLLKIVVSEMPGDTVAVENALRALAAASPTSVAAWQALVAFHHARGDSIDTVLPAFRMSALMAPREGRFMKRRAMFGFERWAELPEGDRRIVVRDFVGAKFEDDGYGDFRKLFEVKSAAERDEIRAAIIGTGRDRGVLLQRLGL
jgi:hypothetical protein